MLANKYLEPTVKAKLIKAAQSEGSCSVYACSAVDKKKTAAAVQQKSSFQIPSFPQFPRF